MLPMSRRGWNGDVGMDAIRVRFDVKESRIFDVGFARKANDGMGMGIPVFRCFVSDLDFEILAK